MDLINQQWLDSTAKEKLLSDFSTASPYKHIVIDNFLNDEVAKELMGKFPAYEQMNKKYDGLNEQKAEGSNFQDFDPLFSKLRDMISSKEFCHWMSEITGVQDLFVTNDALGAGLHQGKRGSFLDIHIDFSMHHINNVYRRLNLLIFFNEGWQDEWKGHTELWNSDMTECVKKVRPDFNRAIIFQTTGKSYHGYGKISPPEGINRKSFYAYFYTNLPGEQDGYYHDTVFKARPEEGRLKVIATNVKETLKNTLKHALHSLGMKF